MNSLQNEIEICRQILERHLKPEIILQPCPRRERRFFITPQALEDLGDDVEQFLSRGLWVLNSHREQLMAEFRANNYDDVCWPLSRQASNGEGLVLITDDEFELFLIACEDELAESAGS